MRWLGTGSSLSAVASGFLRVVGAVALFGVGAQAQTAPTQHATPATPAPAAAATPAAKVGPSPSQIDKGWPRTFVANKHSIAVYQPQVQTWSANQLTCTAAVVITKTAAAASATATTAASTTSAAAAAKTPKPSPAYGIIGFSARTEIDKVNRTVTLSDFVLTKVSFPASPEKDDEYHALLAAVLSPKVRVISLDRLESDLDLSQAEAAVAKYPLQNNPPQIIFSEVPAILVIVDGQATMRPVPDQKNLMRVINTRALILFETDKRKYYLHLMDGWMETDEDQIEGTWKYVGGVPGSVKDTAEQIAKTGGADLLTGAAPDSDPKTRPSLKQAVKNKTAPLVFVREAPTELIVTKGVPQFTAIPGTPLTYASNTGSNLFFDQTDNFTYVLLSGRWFRARSLQGPWEYVAGKSLPPDFAKIPEDSPKANVLASIPGTPQAREALISNSIPQTATITRSEAKLSVVYDGAPQFKPIDQTQLSYAVNTSVPVIQVNPTNYYAVESGVWFTAESAAGPWVVATTVPAVIYTIPPSSPVHYVTYVQVYGSTAEVVYTGYTPGYYGTVVSDDDVVVYGTGWYYPPYIGSYWVGYPWSYGFGVGFGWSSGAGWSVAFGVGWAYPMYSPWWGPAYGPWCCFGPVWGYGGWGGFASVNAYGMWGSSAYARTGAAWANPWTGNYGRGGAGRYYNTANGARGEHHYGSNYNAYTGNWAKGAGGARYNPSTGIVAGGGAAAGGNIYNGHGAAGAGGFAYNTNTGRGIAAGTNNVYAGGDGNVYRYNKDTGQFSKNTGNGWQDMVRGSSQQDLQRAQQSRDIGQQRSFNFQRGGGFGGFGGGGFGGGRMGGFGGRRR
jgi:hypothetical protein